MTKTRKAQRDAKRLFRLCVVDGVLDDRRALAVVSRALANNRVGDRAALAQFRRLVRLELANRSASVESAAKLSDVERTVIETSLAQTRGPGLTTSFVENAELIAGVRIRVGGEIYDGSIRGQLAALLERF